VEEAGIKTTISLGSNPLLHYHAKSKFSTMHLYSTVNLLKVTQSVHVHEKCYFFVYKD